jgi:TDG/mug DNA glycosylase family protein
MKKSNRTLLDIIDQKLTVLFCGINPGLYSAAVGHNFARPGNRFWRAIAGAGFTGRLFSPAEERELLRLGYGITNIVERATARAEELEKVELVEGARELSWKVLRYQPKVLAIVGVTAYRIAFEFPKAKLGLQEQTIGKTIVWVLPNTSGLNAHHQLPELVRYFQALHSYIKARR